MGFPRIISKNNKIYTKLGDFCLSCDGTNFFIVCHICQMELQLQDHFWKHIQDEHNFPHGSIKDEVQTTNYMESETLMPLPLYRKVNDGDQHDSVDHTDDSQDQNEPKDYTEMRSIEANTVQVDIKVEPTNLNKTMKLQTTQSHTQAGTTQTIYQLPQAPATYATIVHTPHTLLPTLTAAPPPGVVTAIMPQEMPKDSSTTASASSAVSSEETERWYICDHETCGLKFKYQSRLELHRAVHSKERRFACDLCGASFKQSCNLSTHRKKKHFLKGSKTILHQTF